MQALMLLKVTKFFLENPYEEVYLRELAKNLRLSPYAIKKYADFLLGENFINEEKKANLRYFRANSNSLFFKHLKMAFNINIILKSGLVDFLKENLANVSSIILYGSLAKGEDSKESDVDILVIGKEKHQDLSKFREKIGKEITINIFGWSDWNKKAKQDQPFYHEIISYGIPLYGELPVVKWK